MLSPRQMSSFLNNPVSGGPAQPCHYQVVIIPPMGMITSNAFTQLVGEVGGAILGGALAIAGAANVSLLAESASLPERSLTTVPYRMYGTTQKIPYGSQHDDLSITFICTNSMAERLFFDTWMSFIMNPKRQYMHYYNDFVGTISILKLANDADSLRSVATAAAANFTFLQAYPVSISKQELSYSDTGEYLSLTVEFDYRRVTTLADEIFASTHGAKPTGEIFADALSSIESNKLPQGEITTGVKDVVGNWVTEYAPVLKPFIPS